MVPKKIIITVLSLVTCALIFVVPVSAAVGFTWVTITTDDWSGVAVFEAAGASFAEEPSYVIPATDNGTVMEFNVAATENPIATMRFSTGFDMPLTLSAGDIMVIEPFNVGGWFEGRENTIEAYALVLYNDSAIVRILDMYDDINITSENAYGVTYSLGFEQEVWEPQSEQTIDEIAVMIYMQHSTEGLLSFSRKQVTVGYGSKEDYQASVTDGKLDALNKEQQETNDKLDDLLQQPEQEKQEAKDEGNGNVNALTGLIPDYSGGFLDAMGSLFSAISYEGTDAALTFPKLYIPAIPGVFDEIELTSQPYVLRLDEWINKLPSTVLSLLRIMGTISLILYCFYELYGAVQYVLTLRGKVSTDGGGEA